MDWTKATQKELKKDVERIAKPFIFTYGSDDNFPYYGGWCIIYAKNRSEACDIHKEKYGLYKDEYLGNFAFCYSAEEFEKTGMCESGNLGNYCHAIHHNYSECKNMIKERAKKIIDAIINDNEVAGLIDAIEDILHVCDTSTPDKQREAIALLLDDLKDDLAYWLAKDITESIDELEELVYAKRKVDTVQIYYDNMDLIGDVKDCSIRDLKGEIIYFAGW